MLRRLRTLALLVLAASALGAVVWVLGYSDLVRYRQLVVVGNRHVTEAAVRHLADLPEGAPLLALDLPHAVAGVERHPWVAHAQARRVFPDTVEIDIQERVVRAVLVHDGFFLVDQDGVPFRRADADQLDHPLLTGIPSELARREPAVARRLIQEALALLDEAPHHPGLRVEDLSEVRFDRGIGYTLALRNGGEVLVGFEGPPALSRLDILASQGVDLSHPQRVDLGLPKLVVVTPLPPPSLL